MSRTIDFPISISLFLKRLVMELKTALPNVLIGVYVTGSLSYGGFEMGKSDIDVAVLLKQPLIAKQIQVLNNLHEIVLAKVDPIWNACLECNYIPIGYFCNVAPPKTPRPYVNNSHFYAAAPYGEEWTLNYALLYEFAIHLYGPEIQELLEPVPMEAVKQACLNDLRGRWASQIKNPSCLNDPAYQAYIPLTLCRTLYTLSHDKLVTKKEAAVWAKQNLEPRWGKLVSAAQAWKVGQPLSLQSEVRQFIRFCLSRVDPIH